MNLSDIPLPAREIIDAFASSIYNIDPGFVNAIYLTGSVTLNDFYTEKSDVDFVVLCTTLPGEYTMQRLLEVHQQIERQWEKPLLSGIYLLYTNISDADPCKLTVLLYDKSTLQYRPFDMAAVTLFELRKNAIAIAGPNPQSLPVKVGIPYLNNFLYNNINGYWKGWVANNVRGLIRRAMIFAFPRLTEWCVLGVARQLYTLQTGEITSKSGAGLYMLNHTPLAFHGIIQEAIAIRNDKRLYPLVKSYAVRPSLTRLQLTVAFVKYAITRFNEMYE